MKRILVYAIFVLVASLASFGQEPYGEVEESLRDRFDRLVTATDDRSKLGVNDSIRRLIEEYAASDSVFSNKFSGIRYLGEITSPDSLIKLITWNVILEGYSGQYFCYLVRRDEGNGNMVYPLEASYNTRMDAADTTFSTLSWYGALYYDLRPVSVNGERCWVMLGLDYGNPEITRKIIDVISFDENGAPVFGKKWFLTPFGMRHRVVFEYAATAMMTLRFSSDTSIVFDHLVPISPDLSDKRQYYAPDYSYDAYLYDKGVWRFSLNVDIRNTD